MPGRRSEKSRRAASPPDGGRAFAERTPFVGRSRELAELGRCFDEGARLCTLLGPPGMGKTRIARRLARMHVEQPGTHAALFCELSEARSSEAAVLAVASTIGVQLVAETATRAWIDEIGRRLAERDDLLLVLDNVEQVVAPVAELARVWIDAAPGVRLLATSRERLHIEGEVCFDLPPLADDEAVELFALRAGAVQRGFVLSESLRPIVLELCRRLDSVPLAIELAAARSDLLPPAALLERLSERLDLLKTPRRDVAQRHATLRQAIDWSWELLNPAERRALGECSVFRGSFTVQAAEAVLDLPPEVRVLDVLSWLRDKSLLRAADALAGSEARLSLYESIREYASERLAESGHADAAVRRHGAYYLELAESERAELSDADAENLRAAVRGLRDLDPGGAARAALALDRRLAGRTPQPLLRRIHDEGIEAAERALDASLLVRLHVARADASLAVGLLEPAAADLSRAIEHARASADRRLEAEVHLALARMGVLAGVQQDDERSRRHATDALCLAQELGDAGVEARSRLHLALVHHRLRELAPARNEYEAALGLARAAGNAALEAQILGYLGELDQYQGSGDAEARYQAALDIHRALGNRRLEGQVLGTLGALRHDRGEPELARAAYQASLAIFREINIRRFEAWLLPAVASLETELGELDQAAERCRAAIEIAKKLGLSRVEAHACAQAAVVEHALGRMEPATVLARRSLEAASATADRHLRAFALAHLGALEAAADRLDAAEASFRAARETLDAHLIGAIVDVLEGFSDLAEARRARRSGDLAEHDQRVRSAAARVGRACRGGDASAPPAASRWADVRIAIQLLERALSAERSPPFEPRPAAPGTLADLDGELPADAWIVGADGRWLRMPDGSRVDLSKYQAVRRILLALAKRRIASPGAALTVDALIAAGWPGESMHPGSGAERVYTSIRVLRNLGLRELLVRRDDGYLLDPGQRVVCVSS